MIGVIAKPAEEPVVREFFELFKVPWEFYQAGVPYDVILCSDGASIHGVAPKLVIVYGTAQGAVSVKSEQKGVILSFSGRRLPIYGKAVTFNEGLHLLSEQHTHDSVAYVDRSGPVIHVHVGYDLFHEVETLLHGGQPPENAASPALDLHIELLRRFITCGGIPILEIPPVPAGYSFITCLTHDLDHALIRRHRFDATIIGFLYRATLGSAANAGRGRLSPDKLFRNWAAAVKLPFIYIGLAKDIWYEFDRYLELEQGRPSTFFVIPFENRPGRALDGQGQAPRARATRYDVTHITGKVPRLLSSGCEIGLHGIDAWSESLTGRDEARRISTATGSRTSGVRMHWLYKTESSAAILEHAGFSYDSTVGYNTTVGYRAGTAQVFRLPGATHLLELPLHIMDTALFYPIYLGLSEPEAWKWLAPMLDNAVRYGGALTINWHDRSIAPERLWGQFYIRLLHELTLRRAWFCTASQAVSWFRKRRSVVFEKLHNDTVRALAPPGDDDGLPMLRLRLHHARSWNDLNDLQGSSRENYSDSDFASLMHVSVPN